MVAKFPMKRLIFGLILIFSFQGAFSQKKDITLEDMWLKFMFFGDGVYGMRSMQDGIHYSRFTGNDRTELGKYEYKSGSQVETLYTLDAAMINGMTDNIKGIDDYAFSADESKIMFSYDSKSVYRYSYKAKYFVYDIASKKAEMINKEPVMYATTAPKGNKVAYVQDNDLYWKDLNTKKTTRVTSDGKWNHVINGASDWVYEEELELVKAFEWSPDGKRIAYYRFDESAVKEFSMDMYGPLYPEQYRFKYPKAGEENSKVSIHIYDLESNKAVEIKLNGEWEYIARIHWTSDPGVLAVQTLNRHQNELNIQLANAKDGSCKTIYTEKSDTYLEIPNYLNFLPDNKGFTLLSEKSGYKHIYHFDMNGKLVNQVTSGEWVVTDFYGVDVTNGLVYYQSAERSPLERDVYVVGLNGSGKKLLSKNEGTSSAQFSEGFKYFIHSYSSATEPSTHVLRDTKGKEVRMLQSNKRLRENLKQFNMTKKEFFSFKAEEGHSLNGWMIKPKDFDPKKRYPVFMFVYGGPGSQTVQNSWGRMNDIWFQMLAQKGYLVVSVDNRGTGARGVKFKKCTYKQLGLYETRDQIAAAKYLSDQSYVDPARIGIFGWSYGGYMSSLCITKGAKHFKMAIAVAPVTTWRYYDTIYTERYMQTPQENESGYDDNSPINHVKLLKGKYLLVHGMADDNVHYQNAVDMITALVNANKQFDQFSYPNKNHGIAGGITRYHLYNMMTNYILENL